MIAHRQRNPIDYLLWQHYMSKRLSVDECATGPWLSKRPVFPTRLARLVVIRIPISNKMTIPSILITGLRILLGAILLLLELRNYPISRLLLSM